MNIEEMVLALSQCFITYFLEHYPSTPIKEISFRCKIEDSKKTWYVVKENNTTKFQIFDGTKDKNIQKMQ